MTKKDFFAGGANVDRMSQEIRALTPDDAFIHKTLMEQAFGRGRVVTPPTADAPPEDMTGVYGLFESGALQAALSLVDFNVHWPGAVGEQKLPMGGIAGVATFAHARGRGYVDQLLRHSLERMRDAGQVVSALYPFAWAFYRRHGWDWVGQRHNIRLPLPELKATEEGRSVIVVPDGETVKETLTPGYTRFAENYRGMFTTNSHKWGDKLSHSDNRTTYVYQHPQTGAYLLWRYNRDGSEGEIREFIAEDAEGYRALLGHLHYLATQCDAARLTLPADHQLWSHVYHWKLETKTEPIFMGRVVDVAEALKKLAPDATVTGSLTLAVHDEQAPWNHGIWKVTHDSGAVDCTPVVGGATDADISLTIQALSQAFWGQPSLAQLRHAGQVTVTREDAFTLLAHLLPPTPVFTLDFF